MENNNNIPSPNEKKDSKLTPVVIQNQLIATVTKNLDRSLFEVCKEVNVSINVENHIIEPDTGLKAERIKIGLNLISK